MDKSEVLRWLERRGTRRTVEGLPRYGIEAKHAFGVPMATLLALRKRLGTDHALSLALWESGWYEARLLAALVGDPQRVTRRQINAWAASWALRAIGQRNEALNAAALPVAKRLALSEEAASRWVGKDALRELKSPNVRSRLARRAQ